MLFIYNEKLAYQCCSYKLNTIITVANQQNFKENIRSWWSQKISQVHFHCIIISHTEIRLVSVNMLPNNETIWKWELQNSQNKTTKSCTNRTYQALAWLLEVSVHLSQTGPFKRSNDKLKASRTIYSCSSQQFTIGSYSPPLSKAIHSLEVCSYKPYPLCSATLLAPSITLLLWNTQGGSSYWQSLWEREGRVWCCWPHFNWTTTFCQRHKKFVPSWQSQMV